MPRYKCKKCGSVIHKGNTLWFCDTFGGLDPVELCRKCSEDFKRDSKLQEMDMKILALGDQQRELKTVRKYEIDEMTTVRKYGIDRREAVNKYEADSRVDVLKYAIDKMESVKKHEIDAKKSIIDRTTITGAEKSEIIKRFQENNPNDADGLSLLIGSLKISV